jgi:hypothetical protein
MQLVPAVLRVVYPGACQCDAFSNMRFWQVAAVACHELYDKVAMLLSLVCRSEKVAIGAIKYNVDVQVAVRLVAHRGYPAARMTARIEDSKTAWLIDTP